MGYFREFKETTKKLRSIRKNEKAVANRFYNIMLIDIKSKVADEDYVEFNAQNQKFTNQNDGDELKHYSIILRQIEKEMNAFQDVKRSLNGLKRKANDAKEQKFKISGEINKIQASPGDTIKKNLFKKVPKVVELAELNSQVELLEKEGNDLQKIMQFCYNIIHDNEFPRLILFKRNKFSQGTIAA